MKQLTWYFDVISPFAYLQSTQLQRFEPHAHITYVPVVFAGLLKHFGNVGPAEIVPKRQWTFEHIAWTAHSLGVPYTPPAMHPFNPVTLLRAIVAAGSTAQAVRTTFDYVWAQQGDLFDLSKLFLALNIDPQGVSTAPVKEALIANGDKAIVNGVFGVPTCQVDDLLFWGVDATDMVFAYLQDDPWFNTPAYRAVKDFPQGVSRVR